MPNKTKKNGAHPIPIISSFIRQQFKACKIQADEKASNELIVVSYYSFPMDYIHGLALRVKIEMRRQAYLAKMSALSIRNEEERLAHAHLLGKEIAAGKLKYTAQTPKEKEDLAKLLEGFDPQQEL